MGTTTVHIGLGSNLGNKSRHVMEAARLLEQADLHLIRSSGLYLTQPVDGAGPEWFINSVLQLTTGLDPWDLLDRCQEVEARLGRKRLEETRARTVDIDLLLYGDREISEERLTVPHPLIAKRLFVLEPLCELSPDLVHPTVGIPVRQILASCRDTAMVMRLPDYP